MQDPPAPDRRPLRRDADSRPLRKDAARNRALLIQAARRLFAQRGFEVSMDEIAQEAGVGVGTAYRHFANKYDLANAIFDGAVESFVGSAEAAMTADDPWDALVGIIERTLEAQTENRAIRDILLGTHQDDTVHHDSMVAPFGPLFERAQRAGVVRADAEFSDIGLLLIMLCTVAETSVAESPYLWRRYLPTLLDGLRPDGAPLPAPALTTDQLRAALSGSRATVAANDPEPAP